MRWSTKERYKINDERIVKRFLWLPLTINGETRWLETARIHQKLLVTGSIAEFNTEWVNLGFYNQPIGERA